MSLSSNKASATTFIIWTSEMSDNYNIAVEGEKMSTVYRSTKKKKTFSAAYKTMGWLVENYAAPVWFAEFTRHSGESTDLLSTNDLRTTST